jgi:phthiodiolone/phenolphthiodiolone dimycocerosates ketoreductase
MSNSPWFADSATDVAAQIEPFIDAGIDWVMSFDYLPVAGSPDDVTAMFGCTVELCGLLKAQA